MKLNKIVTLIVMACMTISCEDYLEEVDYSNISGDTYFATEEGIEDLVRGCYSPLRFYYGKEHSIVYTELGTDIFTAASGMMSNPYTYYSADMTVMGFKGNGQDKNSDYWRYFYLGLNNANAAVNRVPESVLPEAKRIMREGEARFLRAFYLWHIVNIWGGVHFTTEETKSASSELNKTDESVFWEQIIEDLKIAVNYLPETTNEYGRATKPVAQSLLARAYLYTKDYTNALAYADSVINQYDYELLGDYNDLWDKDNDENDEVIWSVTWSENNLYSVPILDHQDNDNGTWMERAEGNQLHLFWTMIYQNVSINGQIPVVRDLENGRSFSRFMPTKFLIDLYDETIDSRFDATFQSVWYCNTPIALENGDSMQVGDTAIYISKYPLAQAEKDARPYYVFDINDFYDPATGMHPGTREQNYTMKKFLDPTRDPEDVGDQSSKFDSYVFRLAEMYFIAAEASFYLNNAGEAANFLNTVRRRAAFEGMEAQMEISAADIDIDFILDEKAREFAGEYIRWFDLKRTDKLVERVRAHNPDAAPNIQEYHRVRPIPLNELNSVSNPSIFTQHEGYQ